MKATHLIALVLLATLAQGASATTIWLKDRNGQVCKNSASTLNAGGVIGLASVDRNGAITMTIDNPDTGTETRSPSTGDCANLPRTTTGVPLVFIGGVTPSIVPIHMLKPGTKGALECLDQGSNFSGVNGSVVSGNQTLSFGFGYTDGCTGGNALPTFSRPVTLSMPENPEADIIVFNGLYHIFNEGNPVPEPGSLLLLVAGAASLILIGLQRRRLVKQVKS